MAVAVASPVGEYVTGRPVVEQVAQRVQAEPAKIIRSEYDQQPDGSYTFR